MWCRRAVVGGDVVVWRCALRDEQPQLQERPQLSGESSTCSWTSNVTGQKSCCARHKRWRACVEEILVGRNDEYMRSEHGASLMRQIRQQSLHYDVGDGTTIDAGLPMASQGQSTSTATTMLTFVQGHRHTTEFALQARMFALAGASLGARSDLLVHSNNADLDEALLMRLVSRYTTHRTKALLITKDNSKGYACGLLHAVARSKAAWQTYQTVLVLHPDVYLLPKAVKWLEWAMRHAPSRAAFLVTNLTPRFLVINGSTGKRGPVIKERVYNTDLFVMRPRIAAAAPWEDVCRIPRDERVGWSERSFWRLIHGGAAVGAGSSSTTTTFQVHRLGSRATSTELPDNHGVWHSHSVARVAAYLDELSNYTRVVRPTIG